MDGPLNVVGSEFFPEVHEIYHSRRGPHPRRLLVFGISNLGLSVSRYGYRAPAYSFGAGAPKVPSSMRPTVKSLGLSMLFLKVFGVKPLFQKGLAGVRGRAPRAPVLPCPDKPKESSFPTSVLPSF